MLHRMGPAAPDDALLRINGEYATQLSMVAQNPLVEQIGDEPFAEIARDASAHVVFNIITNGEDPEPLPTRRMDLRRW